MVEYIFGKKECLNSKILIECFFLGGSKFFLVFLLCVVYMLVEFVEEDMVVVFILISVFKKWFKCVVKCNLVKC